MSEFNRKRKKIQHFESMRNNPGFFKSTEHKAYLRKISGFKGVSYRVTNGGLLVDPAQVEKLGRISNYKTLAGTSLLGPVSRGGGTGSNKVGFGADDQPINFCVVDVTGANARRLNKLAATFNQALLDAGDGAAAGGIAGWLSESSTDPLYYYSFQTLQSKILEERDYLRLEMVYPAPINQKFAIIFEMPELLDVVTRIREQRVLTILTPEAASGKAKPIFLELGDDLDHDLPTYHHHDLEDVVGSSEYLQTVSVEFDLVTQYHSISSLSVKDDNPNPRLYQFIEFVQAKYAYKQHLENHRN